MATLQIHFKNLIVIGEFNHKQRDVPPSHLTGNFHNFSMDQFFLQSSIYMLKYISVMDLGISNEWCTHYKTLLKLLKLSQ